MKIFIFFLLSYSVFAAQVPSLPECSPKTQADKSVTLDCILAEISLHETADEIQLRDRDCAGVDGPDARTTKAARRARR